MKKIHRDAGELREQLVLLASQEVDDGYGAFENAWVEKAKVWARISPAKTSLKVRAGDEDPLITHLIELRQPLLVEAGMRLRTSSQDRTFSIQSVLDPDETQRYWRCECRLENR